MKILYIECNMGAAGDMLLAALYELYDDKSSALELLRGIGIPDVEFTADSSQKCGITGTHMSVLVAGHEEESLDHHHDHNHTHMHTHDHNHEHDHHHHHEQHENETSHNEHHHNSFGDIERLIDSLNIPLEVKEDALSVYRLIAEAESAAHAKPVELIHFHEVGALDAVFDIVGCCLLIHNLSVDKIIVSPINTGSGQVRCAHGILPVPAPATANILKDVPVYQNGIKGELCTPTGAALLKHFASSFGVMPPMVLKKTGYGMGKKDFSAANCVRVMLGESVNDALGTICELRCQIDDMTPEALGFAQEVLLAEDAKDVYLTPINMKKGRLASELTLICRPNESETFARLIFKHTSTIGIRKNILERYELERNAVTTETPYGEVEIKRSEGYGVIKEKPEFEDIAAIARKNDLSFSEVFECIRLSGTDKQ